MLRLLLIACFIQALIFVPSALGNKPNSGKHSDGNKPKAAKHSHTSLCGPHAFYTTDLSDCPRTCENRYKWNTCSDKEDSHDKHNKNNKSNKRSGCQCNLGYVLQDGKCIRIHDCPRKSSTFIKICGDQEVHNYTGNGCGIPIEAKCGKPFSNPLWGKICPPIYRTLCECKMGYARNNNGKCVLVKDC